MFEMRKCDIEDRDEHIANGNCIDRGPGKVDIWWPEDFTSDKIYHKRTRTDEERFEAIINSLKALNEWFPELDRTIYEGAKKGIFYISCIDENGNGSLKPIEEDIEFGKYANRIVKEWNFTPFHALKWPDAESPVFFAIGEEGDMGEFATDGVGIFDPDTHSISNPFYFWVDDKPYSSMETVCVKDGVFYLAMEINK